MNIKRYHFLVLFFLNMPFITLTTKTGTETGDIISDEEIEKQLASLEKNNQDDYFPSSIMVEEENNRKILFLQFLEIFFKESYDMRKKVGDEGELEKQRNIFLQHKSQEDLEILRNEYKETIKNFFEQKKKKKEESTKLENAEIFIKFPLSDEAFQALVLLVFQTLKTAKSTEEIDRAASNLNVFPCYVYIDIHGKKISYSQWLAYVKIYFLFSKSLESGFAKQSLTKTCKDYCFAFLTGRGFEKDSYLSDDYNSVVKEYLITCICEETRRFLQEGEKQQYACSINTSALEIYKEGREKLTFYLKYYNQVLPEEEFSDSQILEIANLLYSFVFREIEIIGTQELAEFKKLLIQKFDDIENEINDIFILEKKPTYEEKVKEIFLEEKNKMIELFNSNFNIN